MKTRILMVDDDAATLQIYSELLRAEGYEVWEASTGREGLRTACERRPDLVLLDVRLPDLSGVEVCRQIKADPALSDTFVVMFSGQATSAGHKVEGLETGADDYLIKTIQIDEFQARIRTIVRLRHAITALRASEQHYRRLVEILPDAVSLIDLQGRITTSNPSAAAMLGYAHFGELAGKSLFDLTPAGEHDRIRADLATTLTAGRLRNSQVTLIQKNGDRLQADLSAAVSTDTKGQPIGMLLVLRDITERKRAELELQKLALVVRNSSEFVNLADLDGRMIFLNEAGSRIVGILPQEVGQHVIFDVISPPYQEMVRTEVVPAILERGRWEGPLQYRNLITGKLTDVYAMTFLVEEASTGEPLYLANVSLDLTERNQAEAVHRNLAAIIENSQDAIYSKNLDGIILSWNQAAERICGYPAEEIIGRPVTLLIPPGHEDEPANILREISLGKRVEPYESVRRRKDGSLVEVSLTVSPIRDATGKVTGASSIARDITEAKRLEKELLEISATERRRVGHELHDGLGQYLAGIAFRAKALEQVLATEASPRAPEAKELTTLLSNAMSKTRSIARGLDPIGIETIGLLASLQNLVAETMHFFDVDCLLRWENPDLHVDAQTGLALYRIAQEAIHNAITHGNARKIDIELVVDAGCSCLRIRDDGIGFQTQTTNQTGMDQTGMGLRVMGYRARSIGAKLKISSQPNQGTEIRCELPCLPAHRPR